MRDAILYSCFLVVALTLLVCVQYGWRPPFALAWDGPSKVILPVGFILVALLSGFGLGALIPTRRLPQRLRFVPGSVITWMAAAVSVSIAAINTKAPATDVAVQIIGAIAVGAVGGTLLAVLQTFQKDEQKDALPAGIRHARLSIGLGIVALATVALVAIPRPEDKPKYTSLAIYNNDGACLELGFTKQFLGRVGVLRLSAGGAGNAVVFDTEDWPTVSKVLQKALHSQSNEWQAMGSYFDAVPGDASTLEVSAGQGIRFAVSSRYGSRVAFELAPSELDSFRAALARMAEALR